jgi:ABC-type bacteriocin/lantibiotic exporter with double-glycine peptidase domain
VPSALKRGQILRGAPVSLRSQTATAIIGTVVAAAALLAMRWLAARFAWSPGAAGVVTFCIAWIALYPIARRNRTVPAWGHWANGAFVLIVLWLMLRWYP